MTKEIIAAGLLIAGIMIQWICCLGLVAMRGPFNRLHAIAPASVLSPLFVAAAVLVDQGLQNGGLKAILIALALLGTTPVTTHVIARAAYIRKIRRP